MFENDELKTHLESSLSVDSQPVVIAEWNMNIPGNIQKLGNYRYRENSTQYSVLPNFFDINDSGNFYTGATDADITVEQGYEVDGTTPQAFTYAKDKEKLLYSLEDCLKPFRPRSGINKLSYLSGRSLPFTSKDMFLRPRYYMPTKDDEFKYWRSFRTETDKITNKNFEYGISKNSNSGRYVIEDTNPFIVYKEAVPANRIVVKLQTNIGSLDLGPFKTSGSSSSPDPFYGNTNKTVPQTFRIQYLDQTNQWLDAKTFDSASLRDDQVSPIFGSDGYLSLEYGVEVPFSYKDSFVFNGVVSDLAFLPKQNTYGSAYLVATTETSKGMLYVFNSGEYEAIVPVYKWFVGTDGTYENTHFVTDLTNPSYYNETGDGNDTYREFVWIKGLRLVVETMGIPNAPLELIELSPRLVANLSNNLIDYNVTKALSDLSGSPLPVGQLMAGTGSITLFDNDNSFNTNNEWDFDAKTGSIIAKYIEKNIKFNFYEVIKNVNSNNYYVPIKTLYSEGFPQRDARTGETSISLRDFYFYFESLKAPRILLTEVSLSQAVCLLLDSIGFSNYVFKRLATESDPVVPYFFIAPEQSVAETLLQLAKATQSAMFFDEYNNFVVMTKEYLLDESVSRLPTMTLYGSNSSDGKNLANIIAISSQDRKVYNAGTINYTSRYIKKTGGTLAQSAYVDKQYVYNPSLLWEVAGSETTTSANAAKQQNFSLSAVPLNTTLSSAVPTVSIAGVLINNTIDIGENAYWLGKFQGFLYANAEIIKFDAVEYNISGTGNVWISNNLEYQRYFTDIPFNGKIYPTGLVRIYSEPYYETFSGITITQNNQEISESLRLKAGAVISHGRGQFGTPIVSHNAGLDSYWSNNDNIQGCEMDSSLLYDAAVSEKIPPASKIGEAGISTTIAKKTQRNGLIKNFLSTKYGSEATVSAVTSKTINTATMQSSALVMTGPDFESGSTPRNFVSYVHKKLDGAYKHFGTRVRIIGKIETAGNRSQSVVGGMTYLNVNSTDPTKSLSLGGGSAGINLVNPITNNGYYFEIAALTTSNIGDLLSEKDTALDSYASIENILFYKVKKNNNDSVAQAVPIRLWGGLGNILVDDGNFAGQYRLTGEENPTVYDLAIEYVDVGTRRDFYLYINQSLVARVSDPDPIPLVNPSLGLFVRGTSKAMFENIYALSKNYATNTVFDTNTPIAAIFGDPDNQVNATEAIKKYALSGVVQNTYLSNIDPKTVPAYNLYFEEFGTILREAAYFNVKYDRAYPALYAKIAPTFNRVKGYTVSGFTADSYGAEFLIFNNTDTVLNLDPSTGNYLRILGIAFTQDTTNTITVDDYLKKKGNVSDPEIKGSTLVESPYKYTQQYEKIKQSRILYGKNDFTLDSIYIQDQDTAENILGWIIGKNSRPRKSVGINMFSTPTLQLGDIVNINYKDTEGIDLVTPETIKYVVYNITYSRSISGPDMTVYLSEV